MRFGQVEFRHDKTNKSYELVIWHEDNKTCYVAAFFDKTDVGYDMRTVGMRFGTMKIVSLLQSTL